jgi:16S rRNA (uracil1498-N3)-methyltransferase
VLRHQAGDEILVFNGAGDEADCRIKGISRAAVTLEIVRQRRIPAPPFRITLAAALLKGEAWEWLVEKATELGVSDVQPMIAEHGVVHLKSEDIPRKMEKWRRLMLETCKQCQRAWMPRLHEPASIREIMARHSRDLALIASLGERTRTIREAMQQYRSAANASPGSLLVLIGPEGDFTGEEQSSAIAAGAVPVTLGPNVLRAETAASAAIAIAAEEMRSFR